MKSTQQIPVVILKTKTGYSAHSPIIEGCVATGKTIDKTLNAFRAAVDFHLEGQMIVKSKKKSLSKILKDSFSDYGTEAFYATIEVA